MAFSAAGLAAGMKRSSICQPRTASGGVAFGGLSLSSHTLQFALTLTVANAVSRSCESRNPDLLLFFAQVPPTASVIRCQPTPESGRSWGAPESRRASPKRLCRYEGRAHRACAPCPRRIALIDVDERGASSTGRPRGPASENESRAFSRVRRHSAEPRSCRRLRQV